MGKVAEAVWLTAPYMVALGLLAWIDSGWAIIGGIALAVGIMVGTAKSLGGGKIVSLKEAIAECTLPPVVEEAKQVEEEVRK